MIDVSCRCGRSFHAPDDAAGKKGKCPSCGASLLVPGQPALVATPLDPPDLADLASDDGPTQDRTLSRIYRDQVNFHRAAISDLRSILEVLKLIDAKLARLVHVANNFYFIMIVIPGIIAVLAAVVGLFTLMAKP